MLAQRTIWPDRRVIDVLQIEHPIVLSPMAGLGTVDLAAAVSAAGGLGSIGCATMEPELAAKTIRAMTDKPINVNFFAHLQAKTATDREEAWRDRLLPYYRELGIDPENPVPQVNIPSFDDVRCRIVEATRPEVVSFHLACQTRRF
jgi:nitronate monooxygenase